MIDRKHSRHDGEEHLSGTNIARGFISPDVLFPCLQGQPVGRVTRSIFGHTDESTRHLTLKPASNSEVSSVRATKAQRNTQTLGCSHRNISATFTRRGHQCHRQHVGGHHDHGVVAMEGFHHTRGIPDSPRSTGILNKGPKALRNIAREVGLHNLNTQRFGPTGHHCFGVGKRIVIDEEDIAGRTRCPPGQQHRLRHSSRFIQHGGISRGHASEVSHHRLKIEQGFETTLRNFWLIRGVGGIPAGVF